MLKLALALGFTLWASASFADQYVTNPTNFTTAQVSVLSTATQVNTNRARFATVVENTTTTAIYCGPNSTVTTSTGFLIPGVVGAAMTFPYSGPVWCVSGGSSATVTAADFF